MTLAHAAEKAVPVGLGARLHAGGRGATFRVFCTGVERVEVVLYADSGTSRDRHTLCLGDDGAFQVELPEAEAGWLYRFALDGREWPDPYARFLPYGVHGPAELVSDEYTFEHPAPRRAAHEHVIYELHMGSFTPEGTYAAATEKLDSLAELGITTLELMPLAAFPGAHGWGYDGVASFAPFAGYGRPDELRSFIDRAHGLGLSVLLDVVYNHWGPAGNYLGHYSPRYFHPNRQTPWGQAPRFDDAPMRALVLENAHYWLSSFGFDGLRFDATHAVHDSSTPHVLAELIAHAESELGPRYFVAEDERNDAEQLVHLGVDATWADDFHHSVHVLLTGERDGYYAAYEPTVAQLARTIEHGWLYEGQDFLKRGPRGKPAPHLPPAAFVYCLENHDQIGNRPQGARLAQHVDPDLLRVATALLLFLPMTPLLFMGQEWAASSPFLYFTAHEAELGRQVTAGRKREFEHFEGFGSKSPVPDPQKLDTFLRSKLDWQERDLASHASMLELHTRLLQLRRTDPVLSAACHREDLRVRATGDLLWVERRSTAGRRTLLCNFGLDSFAQELAEDAGRVLMRTDARGTSSQPSARVAVLFARDD